jgi:hypothetical protein
MRAIIYVIHFKRILKCRNRIELRMKPLNHLLNCPWPRKRYRSNIMLPPYILSKMLNNSYDKAKMRFFVFFFFVVFASDHLS